MSVRRAPHKSNAAFRRRAHGGAGPTDGARSRRAGRRGVAILIVMLLLSITLGLSYAIVRSQTAALRVQQNATSAADRSGSARQAAITGMTCGLKHMGTREWNGVEEWAGDDSVLRGSLGPHERYVVSFNTGDVFLGSDDPEYESYPYRVTLLSTGYAADAESPEREARHQIEAVVQLIPRAVGPEPPEWPAMSSEFTVYQWSQGSCEVHVPCRIEGRIRFQDRLKLGKGQPDCGSFYPWRDDAREPYLVDLATKESVEGRSYPPFGWPTVFDAQSDDPLLFLPHDLQQRGLINLLEERMEVPTEDKPVSTLTGWRHPGELLSYRLYPGGKSYNALELRSGQLELKQTTLKPDPKTNPLGLYYHRGRIDLRDSVTIQGTLITKGTWDGDVHVFGKNVEIVPHDLPALHSDPEVPVRLPGVVVQDDFRIHPDAECSVVGMLAIWDDFEVMPHREGAGGASGTARIDEVEPLPHDRRCRVGNVSMESGSKTVPVGARFTIAGSESEYTVTARTPVDGDQPTESIGFAPAWGPAPPKEGDAITFLPAEHDLTVLSRVVCRHFSVGGRMDWYELAEGDDLHEWWEDRYEEFKDQLGEDGQIDSFSMWAAEKWKVDPRPPLLVTPDPTPARYHWRDLSDPYYPYDSVYVPGEDDEGGLRWDLIEWTHLRDDDDGW